MRELPGLGLGLPAPVPDGPSRHAHHLFTVLVDPDRVGIERDAFLDAMTAQGIGVGVHYLSLPEHPYYQQAFGWAPGDVPNAARSGRQTGSIPLSPALTDDDVTDVIEAIRRVAATA